MGSREEELAAAIMGSCRGGWVSLGICCNEAEPNFFQNDMICWLSEERTVFKYHIYLAWQARLDAACDRAGCAMRLF